MYLYRFCIILFCLLVSNCLILSVLHAISKYSYDVYSGSYITVFSVYNYLFIFS
ncbi:hypothetical protein BY996DRAFT_7275127 [Phakopsora pachyrhizi]|nr:hypothetical protein BY996DRAFT_7275127 [Phakopsora pachyrhizi]